MVERSVRNAEVEGSTPFVSTSFSSLTCFFAGSARQPADKDHKLHEWNERLARLKQGVADIQQRMEGEETEGVGEENAREGHASAGGPSERGES